MSEGRNKFKRELAPGLWEDADGNAHFDIPRVLKHLNVEDTPENRAICMAELEALGKQNGKQVVNAPLPPKEMRNSVKNYVIAADGKSILCLKCLRTSWNYNDIKFCHCGHCHIFHEDVVSPACQ